MNHENVDFPRASCGIESDLDSRPVGCSLSLMIVKLSSRLSDR